MSWTEAGPRSTCGRICSKGESKSGKVKAGGWALPPQLPGGGGGEPAWSRRTSCGGFLWPRSWRSHRGTGGVPGGPPVGRPALLWVWLVRKGSTAGRGGHSAPIPSSFSVASPALGPWPRLLIQARLCSEASSRGRSCPHSLPGARSSLVLVRGPRPEPHSHFCADFPHSGGPRLQARGVKGISDFSCGKEVGEGFSSPAEILCKIKFLLFLSFNGESWVP